MSDEREQPNIHYRAIWISDVHLGFRGCRTEFLLYFLRSVECEFIYLVGNIIDLWNTKNGLYWPQAHNDVLLTLLDKAKRGALSFDRIHCRAHVLVHRWEAATRQFVAALIPSRPHATSSVPQPRSGVHADLPPL